MKENGVLFKLRSGGYEINWSVGEYTSSPLTVKDSFGKEINFLIDPLGRYKNTQVDTPLVFNPDSIKLLFSQLRITAEQVRLRWEPTFPFGLALKGRIEPMLLAPSNGDFSIILNSHLLSSPDYFEDSLDEWMLEFGWPNAAILSANWTFYHEFFHLPSATDPYFRFSREIWQNGRYWDLIESGAEIFASKMLEIGINSNRPLPIQIKPSWFDFVNTEI